MRHCTPALRSGMPRGRRRSPESCDKAAPQVRIPARSASGDPRLRLAERQDCCLWGFPDTWLDDKHILYLSFENCGRLLEGAVKVEPKPESLFNNHVFISYSHADSRWLDQLLRHLRPLVREELIKVFSDRSIRIGADWRAEIRAALDASSITILLISADFLASDFIIDEELPRLLAGAASRGTIIMSVIVGPSLFEMVPSLSQFQTANPPSRPLSAMRPSEWNKVLVDLAREIHRVVSRRP